jgi:hypothetical protein
MAAVAGGAALSLLLGGVATAYSVSQQQQQQRQQEQEQEQQEQQQQEPWRLTFAVQLALVSTAVHALQESVASILQETESSIRQQQQQQQQLGALQLWAGSGPLSQEGAAAAVVNDARQQILSQVGILYLQFDMVCFSPLTFSSVVLLFV